MRIGLLVLIIALLFTPSVICQTAEITPGDNLVVEGIPTIPAALAEELSRYQTRSATLLDWHPSGREMLIRTRFGDTAQVPLVKSPVGSRQHLPLLTHPLSPPPHHP